MLFASNPQGVFVAELCRCAQLLILLKFPASTSSHFMEAQLTICAGGITANKKMEDINYSAGTKKHLRQLPAGSIQGAVDSDFADNGWESKSVRPIVTQIRVNRFCAI